ncbi:MAG: sigma-70 family RNA polymerase sigma factor [Amaricoccus sp.]
MALSLDDYIHCSPYLSVASLDRLLDQPGEDGLAFDIPDPQPSAEVVFDRQRTHDIIHRAVDKLPARQRAVISAIYFVGHTVTETARLLKITAAAVMKLRTKALKYLLNVLAPMREALFV